MVKDYIIFARKSAVIKKKEPGLVREKAGVKLFLMPFLIYCIWQDDSSKHYYQYFSQEKASSRF